jgi:hypothetical protein
MRILHYEDFQTFPPTTQNHESQWTCDREAPASTEHPKLLRQTCNIMLRKYLAQNLITMSHLLPIVLCGELRSSAQFSTQYTPHTHKIRAATLPRWTDNLSKTLRILMIYRQQRNKDTRRNSLRMIHKGSKHVGVHPIVF